MKALGEIPLESVRRIRRSEYDRMVLLGMFEDERVELLNGILVEMNPQGAPHVEVVTRLHELFAPALRGRARIRIQGPLAAAGDSEPEPDLAIIPLGDYSSDHPSLALLVIEVSDSSLRKDRGVKAQLYARAAIPEYWIVNLGTRSIEVYRSPTPSGYADVEHHHAGETLHPGAFPDIAVSVADVIP